MRQLNMDIETYSDIDLSKGGVYRYVDSENFEIQLLSYSVDKGKVNTVDLAAGETIPEEILDAIMDDLVLKYAFNAQFERVCLSKYLGRKLNPKSWRCTMVAALYLGLPGSLALVGEVLGIEKQKLETGKELIKYFAMPCKATKANGYRERNLPRDSIEKWKLYKEYNRRDVEAELEIGNKLSKFPVPEYVWEQYELDQEINDAGIELD